METSLLYLILFILLFQLFIFVVLSFKPKDRCCKKDCCCEGKKLCECEEFTEQDMIDNCNGDPFCIYTGASCQNNSFTFVDTDADGVADTVHTLGHVIGHSLGFDRLVDRIPTRT